MGKVNVVIVDATGNKEQKVGLPDDIKCGIIMVKLVEKIKLPSVGPDGNPISYKFIHKASGRQLLETQTLSEAGVKDGDVLRLQPEITAGAEDYYSNNPVPVNEFTKGPVAKKQVGMIFTIIFSIIGILSGILSIIFGICTFFSDPGCHHNYISYGGDAYTGIQHACAQTATNVYEFAAMVRIGMGGLFIVIGIAIICYFALKISTINKKA